MKRKYLIYFVIFQDIAKLSKFPMLLVLLKTRTPLKKGDGIHSSSYSQTTLEKRLSAGLDGDKKGDYSMKTP